MSHHKSHHDGGSVDGATTAAAAPAPAPRPKAASRANRNHHLQLRDGWWHFVIEWNGRRIRRACKTTDQGNARLLRDRWMAELWRDGMLPDSAPAADPVTVGDILQRWIEGPLESGEDHRRRVANIVRSILRRAHPASEVDRLDQSALSDATVGAWRRAWLVDVQAVEATDGQAAAARMKASGNSLLNQAASLFSSDACLLYQDAGLAVTCAQAWRAACRARGFKVASARARFIAPAEPVVRALLASVPSLLTAGPVQRPQDNRTPAELQRRNLALAVGLMLGGGLRKGESAQLRWEWITDSGRDWLINGAADVKDGGGRLVQKVAGWAIDAAGLRALRKPSGFVLEGHDTERLDGVFRRVSEWMRSHGWEAHKTSHGLRDLAISIVIAATGSAWEGQGFARHASVSVTESHYGHFAREKWLGEIVVGSVSLRNPSGPQTSPEIP